MKILDEKNVGTGKGRDDRRIVADALLAKTETGAAVSPATDATRMYTHVRDDSNGELLTLGGPRGLRRAASGGTPATVI